MGKHGGVQHAPLLVKRFQWEIEKSKVDECVGCGGCGLDDGVKSQDISFGLDDVKSTWTLHFRNSSCVELFEDYGLYIVPDANNPRRVDIRFKIGIITKDGTESNVKRCQIFSGTDAWCYPGFLPYGFCQDESLFRNNQLTIFCDLQMDKKIRVPEFSLSEDFSRMFDSGKFTDFTLVVGKEELKVHRAVLASRSPVFEAMLEHDTEEKQTSRMVIKDLDMVGIKGLLQFIYSGEVKDLDKVRVATKVLPAADKYGVLELKLMCEREISSKFTVWNATKLLTMADLYSAEYLKSKALNFIKKNSSKVAEQEGFYELGKTNPKIFKEIIKSFADAVAVKRVNESDNSDTIEPKEKRIKLN